MYDFCDSVAKAATLWTWSCEMVLFRSPFRTKSFKSSGTEVILDVLMMKS